MQITAAMVKELRDASGAGMSACKNALVEAEGNIARASEILREKGLVAAAKKAGRISAEGLALSIVSDDRKKGAIVEVNSETDFVAKNEDFIAFVKQAAQQVLDSAATTLEAFLEEKWIGDASKSVKDVITQMVATIGENITIRRFERYEAAGNGCIVDYIHGGGRMASLVEMNTPASDAVIEAGRNVCMQVVAMQPKYVAQANIDADYIAKEREILMQQAVNEGRPANIAEKIVEGRLAKSMKEVCLMDQEYIKDTEQTVAQYLKSVGAENAVVRFVRYEKGEGIEKKVEDFAEEVSKAMNV